MSTDVFLIRRRNLRSLVTQYEGATNLAHRLGYTSPSYISQMIGPHPTRQITEKVARQVEDKLTLPLGWLDKPHKELGGPVDEHRVGETIVLVGQVLEDMKVSTSPRQFAELVALVHERGGMDEGYLRRLITLISRK